MTINRRNILLGASGAVTMAAIGLPRIASAKMPVPTQQVVGARRMKLGDMVVTALSDGYVPLNADVIPNGSAEDLTPYFEAQFIDFANGYKAACNAYLVTSGDRTVLIDAGGEVSGFASLGRLDENMKALGLDPADVDALAVTHLHPDHIGGAITSDGKAAFPNAEMIVRDSEVAFWSDDANIQKGAEGFFELARNTVKAYDGKTTMFSGDDEVLPGMKAMALPGHTPGHTGFMLSSGGSDMLVWGDIIHMPPVQFAAPDYYIGFDVNPDQAVETRKKVMDMVATDRLAVAGMHLSFPGFGHVAKDGDAYSFVDMPFAYEL